MKSVDILKVLPWITMVLPILAKESNISLSTEGNKSVDHQFLLNHKVPARGTLSDTLEDASRKLKSSNPKDREGAAKLLGKYPKQQSSLLLIGALSDSSALVRRAALVSLVEHFNNGMPVYDQPLTEKIFSKIGDPDVEVRREATALIPRLVPGLMRNGMERVQINGRTVFRSLPGRLREDLQSLVIEGLGDPDSIVRQNLLKHHFTLRVQIDPKTFAKLLKDPDNGVLITALDQVRMYAMQPGIYDSLFELTKHSNSGVRSKLAKMALSLGNSFPDYRNILRKLTGDKVDDIATVAAVDLARLGERISPQMIDRIVAYLSEARGLYGKAESLFYSLSALGPDSSLIYQSLTDHPSASIRAKAWEKHIYISKGWDKTNFWMPALMDRDLQVRQSVISVLRGRVKGILAQNLGVLIASSYKEVRVFAAELLLVAEKEVVEEYFFELLIDDESLVRSTTLRALANLKINDWVNLHARSLSDDDYAIQRAAMDGLRGHAEKGIPELLKFIRKYPSERISSLARMELEQMGVKP